MRKVLIGLAVVVGLVVVLGAGMAGLSESGEVVVLTTQDASGAGQETRLWIVEYDGAQWLRAGDPESSWLHRLQANPAVTVSRGGEIDHYRAVPTPEVVDRINGLMQERYGLPNRLIGLMSDRTRSVPIRLVPGPEASRAP